MVVAMLDRVIDAVFDWVYLAIAAGDLVMDLVRVVPAFALLLLIEEKPFLSFNLVAILVVRSRLA